MNKMNQTTVGIVLSTVLLTIFLTRSIAGDYFIAFLMNNIVLTRFVLFVLIVLLFAVVAFAAFKSGQQKIK